MASSPVAGSPGSDWEFLTVAEVAEELKVNQMTVRNWIDTGELPAVRVGARRVRVRRSALASFLGIEFPVVSAPPPSVSPPVGVPSERDAIAVALDQVAAGFAALAAAVRKRP